MECKDCELLTRAQRLIDQQHALLELQADLLKQAARPPMGFSEGTPVLCKGCGKPITDPIECGIPHGDLCHDCWGNLNRAPEGP